MMDGYPRPQFRRRDWISLDGPWRFRFAGFDEENRKAVCDETWRTIEVPFAPESRRSGIGSTEFHDACWYEREFHLRLADVKRQCGHDEDVRVLLHFGAVDYQAFVWINDRPVGQHEGGHTPFHFDITHLLDPEGRQRVSVYVTDDPHDLQKPRGKQDWKRAPHSIWYQRTTGIWQTVWIECVPATYIERLVFRPNLERWEIGLDAFLFGHDTKDLELRVELRVGAQLLAEDRYHVGSREVHRRIGLSDPGIDDFRNELLWSPDQPTLIDAHVTLLRRGRVLDELECYTALRSIGTQRERILLNGRSFHMRLVLDQGYWPETLMTPPSDEAIRRDVELAKAMGFNGVRKHQKIEDPRYLYWADRLGLLVWEEMPSAYQFTPRAVSRLVREWMEVIRRDISHPCVVIWVPFNESWGVPDLALSAASRDAVAALYHLTKTLDPTRLVIGNDGWESSATDVIGVHDYETDPRHMRMRYGPEVKPQEIVDRRWTGGRILTLDGYPHRGQPIVLSEFGGVALLEPTRETRPAAPAAPPGVQDAEKPWGYRSCTTREEFEAITLEMIEVVRTTAMFSGYCYTQFADTFQEVNGLLTEDRIPKIPLQRLAAAVRGEPQHLPPLP